MSLPEKIRTLRADKAHIEQQIEKLTGGRSPELFDNQVRGRLAQLEKSRDSKERDINSLLQR